jgi:hypothetical protein
MFRQNTAILRERLFFLSILTEVAQKGKKKSFPEDGIVLPKPVEAIV